MRDYGLFLDGAFTGDGAGPTFESLNPFTGRSWARLREASRAEVDAAVAAAQRAQVKWWRLNGAARAEILHRIADTITAHAPSLAVFESTDNGKIIRETRSQMLFAARLFRFFAGYADKLYGQTIPMDQTTLFDFTVREPYGVVGLITAWNSPITLLCNKLPAALAAGNCVVVKPSEHASVSTLELCRLFQEAGLPEGVVNVVTGGGDVGAAMVEHPGIARISFTGSPGVGARIAAEAGSRLKPVTLELGGKSPNIIFKDNADLEATIAGAASAIFFNHGQCCCAGSRLYVEKDIFDDVVKGVSAAAEAIKLGPGLAPDTEMGPLVSDEQLDRVTGYMNAGQESGATCVTGGTRRGEQGYFVSPTVITDTRDDMSIVREEIFGPVVVADPFDDLEEIIARSNDSAYGLAAGIWTSDIAKAHRVAARLRAGTVWVNTYNIFDAALPFGGYKQSGWGREMGREVIDLYTETKAVCVGL